MKLNIINKIPNTFPEAFQIEMYGNQTVTELKQKIKSFLNSYEGKGHTPETPPTENLYTGTIEDMYLTTKRGQLEDTRNLQELHIINNHTVTVNVVYQIPKGNRIEVFRGSNYIIKRNGNFLKIKN